MWTVPLPSIPAVTAYETCFRGVRDAELRARFDAAAAGVVRADILFRKAAVEGACADLSQGDFVLREVSGQEMTWLYEQRMVSKSTPGREIYDRIRTASPYGRCPLCGHRQVATIDHYLPKTSYHALTVNPANLIPACSDCNKTKLDTVTDMLHPYFDDVEDQEWLRAEVIETAPPVVEFFVRPPGYWPDRLIDRVIRHFHVFGLALLYSEQAARTMSGDQLYFTKLFDAVGTQGLREHLASMADSWRAAGVNSWQVALYDALAASAWYCSGGFRF
jgi:hypothetical protein